MEFKSQCEILKQDLKKAQKVKKKLFNRNQLVVFNSLNLNLQIKVLEKELGENYDIKAILSGQSNWKGRNQQIRTLQSKVSTQKWFKKIFV